MLMRFDPFRELENVTRAVRPSPMSMDAFRDGDHLIVRFDLPGVDPGSIDVTTEQNVLTVRAERRWEPAEGQEVLIAERPQGTFTRELFLGDSLDPERVEATYENGVLTLTIPVAEQAKPRKVEVHSAGDGGRAITADAS